ncbi:hypothetical protein A1O3_04988 [Capronia epimyces CBS 606.96]|uniref:Uncharacterized protein n=1 Tax=Capronia epimyces CBS 606.96 TaxID=1182542 RepID=W9Y523_9EURO|nr:uncharacterized protein A1O3_04988 [Capronia epimyces CBS 606.96]EXJ84321.1 hypothetical protein A1O3_04988 [Capronia epimyces CBS 606.96]
MAQLSDLYEAYVHPLLPSPIQTLSSHVAPLIGAGVAAASNGDMVSLAAFVATLYFSLRIADYIRRSVFGWVVFVLKLVVLLALVNVVVYVNRYGWDRALRDAEWLLGFVGGFVQNMVSGDNNDGNKAPAWYSNSKAGSGAYAARNGPWSAYGGAGSRPQVPVGRGGGGARKRAGGWT